MYINKQTLTMKSINFPEYSRFKFVFLLVAISVVH